MTERTRTSATRPRILALACIVLLLFAACSGDGNSTATSTATEAAPTALASASPSASTSATPSGALPAAPTGPLDVDRAMQHVRALSVDIGIRAAGTEGERQAARYIADVFTSQGYTTEIEQFTFRMRFDDAVVTLPGGRQITSRILDGSGEGKVSGILVDGGTGQTDQIVEAEGRVVLMRRGGLPFAQKVANAQQAGAVAVLVVNTEDRPFRGTIGGQRVAIPALAIDGKEWNALRAVLGQSVTVDAPGARSVTSQNVVARRGTACRAYIGAHYDSVPEGPGANDNASGTATMLEVARTQRADGLCAIAFGSEEVGLYGSQAFVAKHLAGGATFMLNFDMTGRIDRPVIIGDEALTQQILGIVGTTQPLRAGRFHPFASSDHVSFASVGVPAVTMTSGDDPNIHTARDTFDAIRKDDLKAVMAVCEQALVGLLRASGIR
ncbi:MAG: hypothetical protein DWI58_20190 [Chloroflexi bacterium]|nr:MAG: hypothetical protein DWI58_20190 [Chloroflexota bacterium]